jgi:eukaryotic-like serine/threonine-protein kinase
VTPQNVNPDAPTRGPTSVEPGPVNVAAKGEAVGPYHLLELLGEGGFGHVWLAEQREPVRRRVALKLVKPGMDSTEVLARFEAERQALALMDHPNIARVIDAGLTASGRPYFAMEYVQGPAITEYCDRSRLSMDARLGLFIKVCHAVQHAHQKGIIHRDLKPTNVLVTMVDGAPEPKVIDFGIAKAMHQPLTERTLHTGFGRLLGTPEYMSPEQAGEQHGRVDTRTDVYALGVVLYQLLTGVLPFDSQTLRKAGYDGIRKVIIEQTPPKPSTRLLSGDGKKSTVETSAEELAKQRGTEPRTLMRQLRGDLDWIVMKCLEKDPARRYESVAGLAQDIERHLKDEPVTAGPPSVSYRAAKFVRRHRVGVGVGAAFAVLVVAGLGATSALYARAAQDRALAIAEGEKAKSEAERARAAECRADNERDTAKVEEAKAKAAVSFVLDMFESIDPAVAQGRDVLVREVLEDAEKKAAGLEGQPLLEATVRQMLGKAFSRLGKYEEAVRNLARASGLRAQELGREAVPTLESELDLAVNEFGLGMLTEAEARFRKVHADRERVLGADDPATLMALSQVGEAEKARDDYGAAEKTIRRVVEGQTRVLGAGHRDTIDTRCGLADLLNQAGRFEEAEKEISDTAAVSEKSLGPNEPMTLQALSIKGSILGELEKTEESVALLRDVAARKAKVLGADHPGTLTTLNSLCTGLETLGRHQESEPIYRDIIAKGAARLGHEHPTTLIYRNNLAQSLRRQKKFDEAAPIYREVLDIQRRTLGPQSRSTLTTLNNLGVNLMQAQKPGEALPLLTETLAGLTATGAPEWMIGASKTYVGECLLDLGRLDEAEKVLLEAHALLAEKMKPEHERTRRAAGALARLYEKRGDAARAQEWAIKAK